MKRILLFLACVLSHFIIFAQLTMRITSVPTNTSASDKIFVAGTFNNWNPGDSTKILTKQNDGAYTITFSPPTGVLKFKFTRGSWATVEGTAAGGDISDRTFDYSGTAASTNLSIAGWVGQSSQMSTAAANVKVLKTDFGMPQLNRSRKIWIYLPPNYALDSTKRFPVLYMHDGQNLFDKTTSFSGEWQVDETLNLLHQMGDKGCIVVGIDNGGASRLNEYSPWRNVQYNVGGEGVLYGKFIVETLKPYVDANFRTKNDRENTAVAGSSMGGLISMYLGAEYQNVFSKVGVFSPSFWFNDSCYLHVQAKGKQFPMRYFFLAGQYEDATLVSKVDKMTTLLRGLGYSDADLKTVVRADGQHSEWFWAREFGDAYSWLFAGKTSNTEGVLMNNKITLFPNPTDSIFTIESDENLLDVDVQVFDMEGRLVFNLPIQENKTVYVRHLNSGNYIVRGVKNKAVLFVKRLVKK